MAAQGFKPTALSMRLNCTKLTPSGEIWNARSARFIIDGFLFIILDVTCNLEWYVQEQEERKKIKEILIKSFGFYKKDYILLHYITVPNKHTPTH